MSQPAATPEPETTDEVAVEEEPAPLNRAERRARAKNPTGAGRTGPAPDPTLRRGRGPRSHTKRI